MNILNFGSLNIDLVYQVEHIARPGETIASSAHQVFAGGKGANQSAALARAGASVFHAGQVGPDGQWVVDKLAGLGVDVQHIRVGDAPTGQAIIQVDRQGQNSIVLFAGANAQIDREAIDATLGHFGRGDLLLLQNEIKRRCLHPHRGRRAGPDDMLKPRALWPSGLRRIPSNRSICSSSMKSRRLALPAHPRLRHWPCAVPTPISRSRWGPLVLSIAPQPRSSTCQPRPSQPSIRPVQATPSSAIFFRA